MRIKQQGRPLHNAVVWQDRRTALLCALLHQQGLAATILGRLGLQLDNVPGTRQHAANGERAFGMADSWLICGMFDAAFGEVQPSLLGAAIRLAACRATRKARGSARPVSRIDDEKNLPHRLLHADVLRADISDLNPRADHHPRRAD